jgi:pyridoxine 5-phosphate synthase
MNHTPRLSVNLNKIALLRNSRLTGVPSILEFADIALKSGADGLTVHPRPDERHIRRDDVVALARFKRTVRPESELNVEGYPDARLLELVREVGPEQCTLVPDLPGVLTSTEGWRLDGRDPIDVASAVSQLKMRSCRVILFIDPDPAIVERVAEVGADGIEIYTGTYASEARSGSAANQLDRCAETARRAQVSGLIVNIGHDLNLVNLPPLLRRLPMVAEASIGHELSADGLVMGFGAAVAAYKRIMNGQDYQQAQPGSAGRDPTPED